MNHKKLGAARGDTEEKYMCGGVRSKGVEGMEGYKNNNYWSAKYDNLGKRALKPRVILVCVSNCGNIYSRKFSGIREDVLINAPRVNIICDHLRLRANIYDHLL